MTGNGCSCISRRDFIAVAGAASLGGVLASGANASFLSPDKAKPHEAKFYDKLIEKEVQCTLCPRRCQVEDGKRGYCEVRENRDGRYYSLVYGYPVAVHNDPIEKKPFFHVYPGGRALSIATVGCNIECKFCQNWDISQAKPEDVDIPFVSPKRIVESATRAKARAIAYTYSEPTIFYEYMYDCARLGKDAGFANVMISNGFMAEQPLKELAPLMTAIKVDLKAFTDEFYESICDGYLDPIKETLQRLAAMNVWFEIVVLTIPTLNDDADDIKRMSEWIVKELGPDVPVHFTRFHATYKLRNLPRTPPRTLHMARQTAMAQGCNYVYTGNLPGGDGEHTYCPQCKTAVVRRYGHMLLSNVLKDGRCPKCGKVIPGVW